MSRDGSALTPHPGPVGGIAPTPVVRQRSESIRRALRPAPHEQEGAPLGSLGAGVPAQPGPAVGRPAGRALHPWAWWAWAVGIAITASMTSQPVAQLALIGIVVFTVLAKRDDSPWARAIWAYLVLGFLVVAIRVTFTVLLGPATGDVELFSLPQISLPAWAQGIELGGPVMAERVLATGYDALRLATMLIAVGAANALANPKRSLRSVPSALYDLSVAVVVAVTVAPQMVASVLRVRRARRLRGGNTRGLSALRALAIPVLQDAVERSLALAAAMEARGFGRRGAVPTRVRNAISALLLGCALSLCVGIFLLLGGFGSVAYDGTSTGPAWYTILMLALGLGCGIAAMVISGRHRRITHYRPDPWRWQENVVVAAAVVMVAGIFLLSQHDPVMLTAVTSPVSWPQLPPMLGAVVVIALVPAVVAPTPPMTAAVARTNTPVSRKPIDSAQVSA